MFHLSQLTRRLVLFGRTMPRFWRLGFSLLLGIGITVLLFTARVHASGTIVLQYLDQKLMVPRLELQAFADQGTLTPDLQTFLQKNRQNPDQVREWLTTPISPGFGSFLPEKFVLFQINKILGDPLGREDLESLRTAFKNAYTNDRAFSVMEVLTNYPKSEVRLELNRLGTVYTDVALFVTRIEPVLGIAKQLLPEFLCDCNVAVIDSANDSSHSLSSNLPGSKPTLSYIKAHDAVKSAFTIADTIAADTIADQTSQSPAPTQAVLLAANRNPSTNADKRLVLAFGIFRPSITVGELTKFAETGELSRGWRFYFNVANVNREDIRNLLNQEVKVDAKSLDKSLNSLLGELALFEIGQVIQTPSGLANVQALRSTMILSSVKDNSFSLLELLQNYPLQQIQVNGIRLARLAGAANRLQARGGSEAVLTDIEGWLLQVQASAAEDLCDCDQPTESNPLANVPVPTIAAADLTQFLPVNWQSVAPHREDRGNIKVVWLRGTPYEMGYQHGQLLHDEIASIGSTVITAARLAGKGLALGRLASKRTYPALIEECRGLVDATQDLGMTMDACLVVAYADVFQEILGYTLPQELFWDGCNQFVAANNATVDGRLYHGSSVDNDKKPVPYVINNSVLFVRQPNQGLPHVFVGYPAAIWPNSGMNVAGITLGLDTAHPDTPDELSLQGRSNVQIMAKILETATSFDQARAIMETQPRVRANLIMITDGKSRQAGVFEFTGKSLGVRSLQENGVLYVTNHFVLPEMYEKQPLPIDPSSESRFERFKQLMEPDQRSSYYGQFQPEVMAKILRDRVNPYTQQASPSELFDDDASPGGNGALRQAIYDPERLKLWIAAGQPPVPENPFVCFSLGELLQFPNAAPCEAAAL